MCGILGILNFDNGKRPDNNLVARMRDTMYHRGPDDSGMYIGDSVALAHRRLSIIDLTESGRQPMSNEDNSILLVCNGEIYNYLELRKELKDAGHTFTSSSDSEVILHQYEQDGVKCLDKFNGMFSFIIWDNNKKLLFAARDRLGIKPLYYFHDGERIILASEIKAIIEDPSVPRRADYRAIADYLFAGRSLGNKTMFAGINEIEPGYFITIDRRSRQTKVTKYWDVEYNYNYSRTGEELTDELFALLDNSVKIHCRSDASLGCHLSGGLDSSVIVALAARHRKNLKTFSIKFSDDNFIDETPYAKSVASHVGAQYCESNPSSEDMIHLLPYLVWHMDTPMATDGGFAYYTVSKLAHENVKVSLTGHGGDEIFAGYPAQFKTAFGSVDMFVRFSDPVRECMPSNRKKLLRNLTNKNFKSIFKAIRNRIRKPDLTFEDVWIKCHCGDVPVNNPMLTSGYVRSLHGYSPKEEYLAPLTNAKTNQLLDKCLYHDLRVYLPALLHQEDRVSMSVSIESRVPLLDFRIIEFLATVPPDEKVRDLQPKYLLRQCASTLLPEKVYQRKDKFPFPVPGKFWFTDEMNQMKENILLSRESIDRGIFKMDALQDACRYPELTWLLLNIELWFKIFIDKDPHWINKISI